MTSGVAKISKTIAIRTEPPPEFIPVLEDLARESSRWIGWTFRRLYTDKRRGNWKRFGPGVPQGGGYGLAVSTKRNGTYRVRHRALYPGLVRDAPVTQTRLNAYSRQLLLTNVALTWENILNGFNRPRGRLPTPPRVAVFHVPVESITMAGERLVLRLSHPFQPKTHVRVPLVMSRDPRHLSRLETVIAQVRGKTWLRVELVQRDSGDWYAHFPVVVEAHVPQKRPKVVAGVDLGVRNATTLAVVNGPRCIPAAHVRHSGMPAVHRLERVHARVRGLRSMADRGNRDARERLKTLKKRRSNIRMTLDQQTAYAVAQRAKASGAGGLAVEDLKGMPKPTMSRRMNRLITHWSRGRASTAIALKAAENGLALKAVHARGTSSTCPACGKLDRAARDRGTHRFTCRACHFSENDDAVGAINIAQRGWSYWNSPKWEDSQSNPGSGSRSPSSQDGGAPGNRGRGVRQSVETPAREAFAPDSKQPKGGSPVDLAVPSARDHGKPPNGPSPQAREPPGGVWSPRGLNRMRPSSGPVASDPREGARSGKEGRKTASNGTANEAPGGPNAGGARTPIAANAGSSALLPP